MEIITFDGTKALKYNCRKIKGEFYEQNRQCFQINGRWYRTNSGYIEYDHDRNIWVLKGQTVLIEGIVDFDKNGEIVKGYFSPNPTKNVYLRVYNPTNEEEPEDDEEEVENEDNELTTLNIRRVPNPFNIGISQTELCLSEEIALKGGYKEIYSSGYFIKPENFKNGGKLEDVYINNNYNFRINYQSSFLIPEFKETFDRYKNFDNLSILPYWKLLGNRTWGIECETQNGFIREDLLRKYGWIALRDGSIPGHEFTSIPHSGSDGLIATKNFMDELSKRTTIDRDCSLHIHLGTLPVSKEFTIAAFIVLKSLEKELYSLFPKGVQKTSEWKSRGTDYCNPLPDINLDCKTIDRKFNNIYKYYSNGRDFVDFTPREHPDDTRGRNKWYIKTRYAHTNLVSYLFGNRRTIEFRMHTATQNSTKVINWLFITNAIVKFIELNSETISKNTSTINLDLDIVLKSIYSEFPEVIEYLTAYIEFRKQWMNDLTEKGDTTGKEELITDKEFTFEYQDIKSLVL